MAFHYIRTGRQWLTPVGSLLLTGVLSSTAQAVTTVDVTKIQATNTQAVIPVATDQPGNCKWVVTELGSAVPVNDVNPKIFVGSNSGARSGSVSIVGYHFFVVGTRTAGQGADGKWYSRALTANTAYAGTVTCGGDEPVGYQFQTPDIPLGVTYTDSLPYNSRALGSYALPTIDFSDLTKWYIDPQTGFKFKLLTGPGQMPENSNVYFGSLQLESHPGNVDGEASGVNWLNPAGGLVSDGSYAIYTAPSQDVLTLRLASGCPYGECSGYDWDNVNGSGNGYHCINIDAYILQLTGNGAGTSIPVDVALSWNGVTPGSDWQTITLPASNGMVSYPANLAPGFAGWQGPNHPIIPGMYWHTVQQKTIVNTNSVTVTYVGAAHFSLDPRILTAGSKITINGTEYTIASVDSATQLTLTSNAGNLTNATAYLSNFSVLVRKHNAAPGTLNIDGAAVTTTFSNSFSNGGSGFQNACSHLTSTDSAGDTGRFCLFQSHEGEDGIYWVTNNLDSRFVGRAYLIPSSLGVTSDEFTNGFYHGLSLFDTNDPNSWWTTAGLVSGGHNTLVKITYNPAGVAGCQQTADYRALAPNATYDANSADNCNLTYTEVTRPSEGKDLYTQIGNVSGIPTSDKMGNGCNLSFVQNGYGVVTCSQQQDSEAWVVTVNLSTGLVQGVWSTYMNAGKGSCRACVLHGVGPGTPTDNWFYLIYNSYPGGPVSGLGPYNLTINTGLTATPSISATACQSLVIDPSVAWMLQYADGCDQVTYAGGDGIPCDPDPSPWEASNMPACSWHNGWTQWQAGAVQIGDWFQDPATGYELFVIGAKTGNVVTLLRNVNVPHGPDMAVNTGIPIQYLRAHAAGWTAGIWCSYHQNAFINVTTETDGTGMLWDRKFFDFNHGVLRSPGIISAEWYDGLGFGESVRMGTYPSAANQPQTTDVLNMGNFAGATGLGGLNYLQSHPGWDGNLSSFTDMAPMAPSNGGSFTLWPQTGVIPVGGSLYKLPAANAYIPLDTRRLATAVWSGMYNFRDVSGTGGLTGTAAQGQSYCVIAYPGATCGQPGEVVGDIFLNIPQATIDGYAGGTYDLNRVNVVPLGQEPMAALQYYFAPLTTAGTYYVGRWERRITTGFGRYNGQDTYSNAKLIFNSNILLFNCGTPNLQRIGDICAGIMPSDPTGNALNQANNGFRQYPVGVKVGAQYAEVQFGYAENGAPSQYFCASRQEPCNTSNPPNVPFNWEGEPRSLTPCTGGCTINIPVLPGRVVYYRTRLSADGVNWMNGPMQVAGVY